MTRRFSILLLGMVAALVLARPTFAQSTSLVIFNTVPSYEGVYDGYYGGLYQGTVNGVATNFVCDDFLTDINYGQSWNAYNNNSSSVGPGTGGTQGGGNTAGSPGTGVRYAPTALYNDDIYVISNPQLKGLGLTQQQEYNMIGWLVGQIFSDPTNQQGHWGSLAGAIWSIADDGWNNGSGQFNSSYLSANCPSWAPNCGTTAQEYVQEALAHDNSASNFAIYTPEGYCTSLGCINSANNGQEFWAQTPEPAAITLLAWGTLALALAPLVNRLRRKKLVA